MLPQVLFLPVRGTRAAARLGGREGSRGAAAAAETLEALEASQQQKGNVLRKAMVSTQEICKVLEYLGMSWDHPNFCPKKIKHAVAICRIDCKSARCRGRIHDLSAISVNVMTSMQLLETR